MSDLKGWLESRAKNDPVFRFFTSGVRWSLLGASVSQGSTFVMNVLIANLLGRDAFGSLAVIQSTVVNLGAVLQLSIGLTATKFVAEHRERDPARAGRVLGFCGLVAIVTAGLASVSLLVLGPWVAEHIFRAAFLKTSLLISAPTVAFSILNGFLNGALNGLNAYRRMGLVWVISGLAGIPLSFAAALKWGVPGAVGGLAAAGGFQTLLLVTAVRREARAQNLRFAFREAQYERDLFWMFSIPAALGGLTAPPALWLGTTFLTRFAGVDQVALYSASFNLRTAIMFAPLVVNGVTGGLLNRYRGIGSGTDYRRLFRLNLLTTGALVLIGGVCLVGLGPHLLRIFGRSFESGYAVLVVLAAAALIEGLAIGTYQAIQAEGAMWTSLFLVALPRDVSIAALAYFLTKSYGAFGLACAYASGWSLACALSSVIAYLLLKRHGAASSALAASLAGERAAGRNPA